MISESPKQILINDKYIPVTWKAPGEKINSLTLPPFPEENNFKHSSGFEQTLGLVLPTATRIYSIPTELGSLAGKKVGVLRQDDPATLLVKKIGPDSKPYWQKMINTVF